MADDLHGADPHEVLAALAGLDPVRQLALLTETMHAMIADGVPALEVFVAIGGICRRLRLDMDRVGGRLH